jgi:D-alanyl-D-alanine carboxypeptidase
VNRETRVSFLASEKDVTVPSRACHHVPVVRLVSRLATGVLVAAALLAAPAGRALARTQSAILLDYDTGQVLQAESPDAVTYPASLTKMMTLYLLFDALDAGRVTLDSRFVVSPRAASMPPTKLGLRAGSTIRVEDAIMALVTRSANDIACAIAENLAGSEDGFADLMTARARQFGMSRTTFHNASGLPDPEQQTTARDISMLATHLISDHPSYYHYFSRESFAFGRRRIGNHNHLLGVYAGMDGIKTGYTTASGFNLAASAVRGGHRLVAVVMGGASAPTRDARMVSLLNRGFDDLAHGRVRPTAPGDGLPELRDAAYAPAPGAPQALAQTMAQLAAPVAPTMSAPAPDRALAAVAAQKAADAAEAQGDEETDEPAPPSRRAGRHHLKVVRLPKTGATYGIQLGSFGDAQSARRAAQQALRQAPVALRGTLVNVRAVKQHRRLVYRVQLVGTARGDAQGACRELRRHHQACSVVQAKAVTVAAD